MVAPARHLVPPCRFPRGCALVIAFVVAALFADARAVNGQDNTWRSVGPSNIGGHVTGILIDPDNTNILLVSTETGGIWRSTDAGASWQVVDDGLTSAPLIYRLARHPVRANVVFAATSEGVLRSDDHGIAWRLIAGSPKATSFTGSDLAIAPDAQSIWHTTGGMLYRSGDEGATWSVQELPDPGPLGLRQPRALSFSPVDSSTIMTGRYLSTNGGASWQLVSGTPASSSFSEVAFAPATPDVVYVIDQGAGGTVYRSINGGASVAAAGSVATGEVDWAAGTLWVDPTNSSIVVVGYEDLWRSTDGGASFTAISAWAPAPLLPGGNQRVIVHDPGFNGTSNRRVYVGTDAGLFRVDDIYAVTPASGWTSLNDGFISSEVAALTPTTGAFLVTTPGSDVLRVTDASPLAVRVGGATQFTTFGIFGLMTDATDPSYVYRVGGITRSPNEFYRSSDGGVTFSAVAAPSSGGLLLDPNNGQVLYHFVPDSMPYAFDAAIWRTTTARSSTPVWEFFRDGGDGTTAFAPGSSTVAWESTVGIKCCSTSLTRYGEFSSPTAAGLSIAPPGTTISGSRHIFTIATSDGQVGYDAVHDFTGPLTGIWRTATGGDSWTRVADVTESILGLTTHPNNPDWVFARTNNGLRQSTDGGVTWTSMFPVRVFISSLTWRGTTLFAATRGRGVWRIDLPGQPAIATQVVNQTRLVGQNATFSVAATGAPAVSYQWQVSTDGGSSWSDLANTSPYSGVTTAALTITAAPRALNGARYRVVIANSLDTVTSAAGTLSVTAAVTALAVGEVRGCAVTGGGGVSCWDLGLQTPGNAMGVVTPVTGLSSGVMALAAGQAHTCALTGAGGVVCWGANTFGQLGDGTTTTTQTPVDVTGLSSGVVAVAAGLRHSCAVMSTGGVKCWGSNTDGQLGDGTLVSSLTPVSVTGLSSAVAVDTGSSHTCARLSGGQVSCWGANNGGQLGDGTVTSRLTPVLVSGLTGVTAIALGSGIHGSGHSCAITASGGVACWGANTNGQLGDGTKDNRTTPVAVAGLLGVTTAITTGFSHSCALDTAGRVRCWGGSSVSATPVTLSAVPGLPAPATAIDSFGDMTCAQSSGGVVCWRSARDPYTHEYGPVRKVDFGLSAAPNTLPFVATKSGASLVTVTPAQAISVSILGAASTWTASADQPWLQLSQASGTGSQQVTASVINPGDVIGASTSLGATITVLSTTSGLEVLATVAVTLTVTGPVTSSPPFGSFDTPAPGPIYSGSVAVTGWALDDIGVSRVELWRDLAPDETTTPYAGSGPGNGKVFIANMPFVPGARPDVEQLYSTTPLASRAGWGYLMLTQGLWNQGNGSYTLYAFAYDASGNSATLGSKTIAVNNAAATLPFGSIDTPEQGQTVTSSLWNYGWALTPNATPGCTIGSGGVQVRIDSGPLMPVTYGDVRADIASGFPGYTNAGNAGGAFYIDTSGLANGTHQIGWLVTDDCARAAGMGSRFFTVLNGAADSTQTNTRATDGADATDFTHSTDSPRPPTFAKATVGKQAPSPKPIEIRRGFEITLAGANQSGTRVVVIGQGEHVEIQLPDAHGAAYSGYHVVNGGRRALPLGSTLDAVRGIFYWQPAPGFMGAFDLEFESSRSEVVHVRAIVGTSVQAAIDTPAPGPLGSSLTIAGWAIDEAARTGTGIDTVHVWAHPVDGAAPIFLGVAAYGDPRPDIGALFGEPFTGSSYSLVVDDLAPGVYDIVVYPHSAIAGDFLGARGVRVTVK